MGAGAPSLDPQGPPTPMGCSRTLPGLYVFCPRGLVQDRTASKHCSRWRGQEEGSLPPLPPPWCSPHPCAVSVRGGAVQSAEVGSWRVSSGSSSALSPQASPQARRLSCGWKGQRWERPSPFAPGPLPCSLSWDCAFVPQLARLRPDAQTPKSVPFLLLTLPPPGLQTPRFMPSPGFQTTAMQVTQCEQGGGHTRAPHKQPWASSLLISGVG